MAQIIAEQIVEQLLAADVHRIYGVVGDSLNPIVDAVRKTGGSKKGGIDWVHVRHEEVAAFAASAEAQLTGKLAVCAGSCGPGNTHLINGVYDANRSGAPVLAIASHIPTEQIGEGYFQETHPERIFVDASVYCDTIMTAAQSPRVVATAMRHAETLGGAAVIVVPGDVTSFKVAVPAPAYVRVKQATLVPSEADVQALADEINRAKTVAIFAGIGVRDARAEVLELAELLKAPIGHTMRGKAFIQYDNPFDVGMTGLLGYGAANAGIHDADVLLMLGTDFPYEQFLPDDKRTVIAQIDTDAAVIGRRANVKLPIHGDVGATIRALLPKLKSGKSSRFLEGMLKKHERLMGEVGGSVKKALKRSPIHPEVAAAVLNDCLAEDAVVIADTGMCNVWQARYIDARAGRDILGSFKHGSMANAMPMAIGAQRAQPGRQVVAMCGDGGLSMLLGDILTIANEELPVKLFVFNNSSLGMVKAEMLVDGLPDFGTEVPDTDYAAIARAAGIHGVRVNTPAELRGAIEEALKIDGPALVDMRTDPNALSMPPEITLAQLRGFGVAMTKTVLNGGAGEVMAMAKTNLKHLGL